ncbi:NAD-dependent epimerase/dehydratase family protein [Mucilaginibacter limnophilus]|uniref:NAD-dependent epimerase/dehydratase family protein n=1 Tax=Mucilaginibacter limnophilus TaxID=1932778 RepID=A0A437MKB1_9SPHI|nr:NAD(P)H-binding protein [Mucilaginibacter limnophilus]RVT98046.1 NAD-dependent epimerase/dehydratase family protein [Mucilaginibacter limnophilus]
MQSYKTIAVIGGTGKAGKYVVKQLLTKRYHLKLLVHQSASKYANHALVQIIKGDVRNPETLRQLFTGCNAVVSMLGQPKNETDPVFAKAAENIIAVMDELHINRYIAVTGLSIDVPGDNKSEYNRQLSQWVKANYPAIFESKQKEYELLAASNLNWTLLRVPVIRETDEQGEIAVHLYDCPGMSISAADLGNFIKKEFEGNVYLKQAPFVANA